MSGGKKDKRKLLRLRENVEDEGKGTKLRRKGKNEEKVTLK